MGKKADNALVFRRVLAASGLSDTDVNRKSRKHEAEIILGLGRPEPVPWGLRSVL